MRHGEEAFPFGSASISLATIERHVDDRKVASKWLDLLPSRQLWHPPLGVVELGIIGCKGLLPMRAAGGKGCTDAYAVAKYGPMLARTRTIADTFHNALQYE